MPSERAGDPFRLPLSPCTLRGSCLRSVGNGEMPFSDGSATSAPECYLPVGPGGAFPILSITEQIAPTRRPHHILTGGTECPIFLGGEMTLIGVGDLVLE